MLRQLVWTPASTKQPAVAGEKRLLAAMVEGLLSLMALLMPVAAFPRNVPNCDSNKGLVDGACLDNPEHRELQQDLKHQFVSAKRGFAIRVEGCAAGKGRTNKPSACVLGQINGGITVHLLKETAGQTCRSNAIVSFMAGFEAGPDFAITRLNTSACPGYPFQLAYIAKNAPKYRRLSVTPLRESGVTRQIDRMIRQKASEIEKDGGEHPVKFGSRLASVHHLPHQAPGTYLATMDNNSGARDPTHLLISQDSVKLIHGAARIVSFFTLNGRSYAHYNFKCYIGCGWGGDLLLELRGIDFQTVVSDDSGST